MRGRSPFGLFTINLRKLAEGILLEIQDAPRKAAAWT